MAPTPTPVSDRIAIELSAEEALTVVAALRQYMPYWPSGEHEQSVAERLAQARTEIASVISKVRTATAS